MYSSLRLLNNRSYELCVPLHKRKIVFARRNHNNKKIHRSSFGVHLALKSGKQVNTESETLSALQNKVESLQSLQSLQRNFVVFTTCAFSSIIVLTTCICLIICARETTMEAAKLHDDYTSVKHELKQLEEKNIEDEMIINALVNEIISLRNIGVL
jgi:hypothetical protein